MARGRLERFFLRFAFSGQRVATIIFGVPRLLAECQPDVQEAIIRRVEARNYGPEGLLAYERRNGSASSRLIRRAVAQHLCHRELLGSDGIRLARRLVFGALLPVLFAHGVLSRIIQREKKRQEPSDVVVMLVSPEQKEYAEALFAGRRLEFEAERSPYLGFREVRFLAGLILDCPRLLLYPELLASVCRWVSYYGWIVAKYRPATIAHSFESSAPSSIITAYLRRLNIRHVNLMHGERFFSADAAFSEFDEFHVWGEHFRRIFARLRHPLGSLIVSTHPGVDRLFHTARPLQPRPRVVLIAHNPFLTAHGRQAELLRVFLGAFDASWTVRIRWHPRYRHEREGFSEFVRAAVRAGGASVQVNDESTDERLEAALAQSAVVVGNLTTVLVEAWVAGCKVVYLAGGTDRSVVMERFDGSPNVLYVDADATTSDVEAFLAAPPDLSEHEGRRVDNVCHIHSFAGVKTS